MEKWKWPLWQPPTRRSLQSKSSAPSSLLSMWVTRASFKRLSEEEEMNYAAWLWFLVGSGEQASSSEKPAVQSNTNEGVLSGQQLVRGSRNRTKRSRFAGDDPGGEDEPPKDKIMVNGVFMSFEEYIKHRKFIFLHHFSGPVDNLSIAVKEESERLGLVVDTSSSDLETGQDLMREQPYRDHRVAAEQGLIDGYHAGFPCTTFTKLRWREAPGMPRPVRSKGAPYGLQGLSDQ